MKVGEILLEVVRNELVESVHAGHLLIIDSNGNSILELGDLDALIYPRSAIKAIQAAAMVRAGLKLSPKQLALVCASHAGSSDHLETAQSILGGAGLDESALKNTPDRPLGTIERIAWGDRPPTSLAANCSGKHSGMVATCAINGWDLESYKDPGHPLQQRIQAEFEELTGRRITKIAIDGCGAPLFALSLRDIARGINRLLRSSDPVHREVISACCEFPIMVSGVGRLPTILMEEVADLFVKDGAEGVMVMAHPKGTVVWKMSDGSQRGAGALAAATLLQLGLSVALDPEFVRGGGEIVGEIRPSRIVTND